MENYLGKKEYEYKLEEKTEQIKNISEKSLFVQGINYELNKTFATVWGKFKDEVNFR